MRRCFLGHQIDALHILHELWAHKSPSGDVLGPSEETPVHRCKTITERARESCFTRLMDILKTLISIEEELMKCASKHEGILLRSKDSVDLKNICLRMALSEAASYSHRDLKELRDCLRHIVGNLQACVRDENGLPYTVTGHKLREISNSFPEI